MANLTVPIQVNLPDDWVEQMRRMNHYYVHCLNFRDNCPKKCFRAQLSRDLRKHPHLGIPIDWMNLEGTEECLRKGEKDE